MAQIERGTPKLLYIQIVEWMNRQVDSGAWPEHYKLKPETELAAELGVNRGTVRKAIAELVAKGRLVSLHGRGTFVASQTLEQPLAERLITFSEDLLEKKIPFETCVLDQSVIVPPPSVASLLSIPPERKVFFLKRVRKVAQQPLILLHNYVVYDCCPGIETVDWPRHRLFEILEKRFKLDLAWGRRIFQAQTADQTVATHLDLEPGAPVMFLEQLVYQRDGTPIEYSNVWLRGNRCRLSAVVKRNVSSKGAGHSIELV